MTPPEREIPTLDEGLVEEPTIIEVKGPIPFDVGGTLIQLIGSAYPAAQMASSGPGIALTFVLPPGSRPKPVPKRAKARTASSAMLMGLGPEGVSVATPRDISLWCADIIDRSFVDNPDAENYLEMDCRIRDKRYVLTFARSKGQSPHALRVAAEAKAASLESRLRSLLPAEGPEVDRVAAAIARDKYETEVEAARLLAAERGAGFVAATWDELGKDRQVELAAVERAAARVAVAVLGRGVARGIFG